MTDNWWNPKYVPPDLRKRAIYLKISGHSVPDIAERLLISPRSIYNWYDIFKETGDIYTSKERAQRNGVYVKPYPNKRLNNKQAHDILYASLNESSRRILKENQECLLNQGIRASIPTIHRFWESEKVTRKKCGIFGRESDPYGLLDFWQRFYYTVDDVDMMLWGDESHRNDHTQRRSHGRSKRGERCYDWDNMSKGGYRLSLELFGDITGPVVYEIYHGSVSSDDFVDFAWKELYDHINPYPSSHHSVIMIDNCTIHHTAEFDEFVEETEVLSLYLAEYQPWLNLIEWMFNGIKMREKHKQICGEYQAMVSLSESVEDMKGKDWSKVLKRLGYIQ